MSDSELPYWVLISVLFSSVPLNPELAITLSRRARALHRAKLQHAVIDTALAKGELRSLEQGAAIGSISGPVFEAKLETERGAAVVRFVLTRQGLELADELDPPPTSAQPTVWN
ncbi:MAG: hypothetical protein U1E65_03175 [Myxococcota bacterium]